MLRCFLIKLPVDAPVQVFANAKVPQLKVPLEKTDLSRKIVIGGVDRRVTNQ